MNGWKKCVYFFFFEQIIWKLSLFFNLPWYDCPSLFLVSVTWHAKGLSWTHQRNLQSTSKVDACQAPWAVILHAFYICICVLYGAVRNGKLTNLPLQIKIQKKIIIPCRFASRSISKISAKTHHHSFQCCFVQAGFLLYICF